MATELLYTESRTTAARESTYGTDAVAAAIAANGALRYETYTDVQMEMKGAFLERDVRRGSFSNNRGVYLKKNLGVTISGYVPTNGTAGDAPLGLDNLLVCCGFTETDGGTSFTYALDTDFQGSASTSLSIWHWQRHVDAANTWRAIYATGVRGSLNFSGSVGEFVSYTFTGASNNFPDTSDTAAFDGWSADLQWFDGSGGLNLDPDGTSTVYAGTETYDDPNFVYLEAATITVDGVQFPCSAFSIDIGNVVNEKEVTEANTVVDQVLITGRNVTGDFTLEDTGAAFEKALAIMLASSEVTATIVMSDRLSAASSTVTITMPDLQVRTVGGPNDSNGLASWTVGFQANGDHATDGVADDEISIVWSTT